MKIFWKSLIQYILLFELMLNLRFENLGQALPKYILMQFCRAIRQL